MSNSTNQTLAPIVPLFEGPQMQGPAFDSADGAPLNVKSQKDYPCPGGCAQLWLDTKRRILECKVCGFHLEPFDFLLKRGNALDTQTGWIRRLGQERRELERQVAETKKQLVALRSGVRKAGGTPIERHQIQEMLWHEEKAGA